MMLPHPHHAILNLEKRQADLRAEGARDQRARLAEDAATPLSARRWLDLVATLVAFVALALLVAAGIAIPARPPLIGPLAIMLP